MPEFYLNLDSPLVPNSTLIKVQNPLYLEQRDLTIRVDTLCWRVGVGLTHESNQDLKLASKHDRDSYKDKKNFRV